MCWDKGLHTRAGAKALHPGACALQQARDSPHLSFGFVSEKAAPSSILAPGARPGGAPQVTPRVWGGGLCGASDPDSLRHGQPREFCLVHVDAPPVTSDQDARSVTKQESLKTGSRTFLLLHPRRRSERQHGAGQNSSTSEPPASSRATSRICRLLCAEAARTRARTRLLSPPHTTVFTLYTHAVVCGSLRLCALFPAEKKKAGRGMETE